jgi:hypothetical protein
VESDNENEALNVHLLTLLSVASGMAGVCATAIGLIGIVKNLNKVETLVDDLFAIGSVLFLFVTGLSFLSLRTKLRAKWRHLVLTLDVAFFLGLSVVVVASALLTYMVI